MVNRIVLVVRAVASRRFPGKFRLVKETRDRKGIWHRARKAVADGFTSVKEAERRAPKLKLLLP